jgi:hypothetical protein
MKMLRQISLTISPALFFCIFCFYLPASALAEDEAGGSLLEYYNRADQETLNAGTEKMAEDLKGMFDKEEIIRTENDLQFSRYFTNFKNLVLYANKLAGYVDWEENIKFGRDNELYRELPKEGELTKDKKLHISEKYNRLEGITVEEINTYREMMEISFNACEFYTENDFAFFDNRKYREKMEDFFQGGRFQMFEQEKRELLEKEHSDCIKRIDTLVAAWRERNPDPDSPIIAPEIIESL